MDVRRNSLHSTLGRIQRPYFWMKVGRSAKNFFSKKKSYAITNRSDAVARNLRFTDTQRSNNMEGHAIRWFLIVSKYKIDAVL